MDRRRTTLAIATFTVALFGILAFNEIKLFAFLGLDAAGRAGMAWHYAVHTLLWLAGAFLLIKLANLVLWDAIVSHALRGPVPAVLKEMFAVVIYLVALTGVTGLVFEKSVTGFLAALGASGFVLGLALRSLFSDIFTGLAINIDHTLSIGDWIEFYDTSGGSTIGRIEEMGWRCTRVVTEEGTSVIVPNSILGVERVINLSRPIDATRFDYKLTIEFSVPVDRVRRVLLASLHAVEKEPGFSTGKDPEVLVSGTSALGVEYLLRYWILPWNPLSPSRARDLVLRSALRHLRTAGVALAYPKTDIYHSDMPHRQVDGQSREDRIILLSRIDLFSPLEEIEIARVAASMKPLTFSPGADLVTLGDHGESLFVLIEGVLDVLVEVNGSEKTVALLAPGEFFGELSLLTGEKRSATVRAVTEAVVYEIGKDVIIEIMQQRPSLAENLATILARRRTQTEKARTNEAELGEIEPGNFARHLLDRMRNFLFNQKAADAFQERAGEESRSGRAS